ncbi:hypothetical protein DRQ53_14620 [bacterium]|nr:MAG: hypothetical protein DRQ53_14620 [bacterium]
MWTWMEMLEKRQRRLWWWKSLKLDVLLKALKSQLWSKSSQNPSVWRKAKQPQTLLMNCWPRLQALHSRTLEGEEYSVMKEDYSCHRMNSGIMESSPRWSFPRMIKLLIPQLKSWKL